MSTLYSDQLEQMSFANIAKHHDRAKMEDPRILRPLELAAAMKDPALSRLVERDREALEDHYRALSTDVTIKASREEALDCILGMGETEEAAIRNFCKSRGMSIRELVLGDEMHSGELGHLEWGRHFTAGDTSVRCAGRRVPGGGFIVTWWK